jgi:Sec-independent protein translocase protein TatA
MGRGIKDFKKAIKDDDATEIASKDETKETPKVNTTTEVKKETV